MTAPARTVHRPGARALKRHLRRALRRRARRTLKALSKRRDARAARRAERQIERRRTLASGTAPTRPPGGAAKPAPNLIGPAPVAKKTTSKPTGAKKTAKPRPGAGKPCKRCNGTGVIHLRKGGKYAGAKPCPHVVAQWKKARANTKTQPQPSPTTPAQRP